MISQKLILFLFFYLISQHAFSQLNISGHRFDVCPGVSMLYTTTKSLSEGCNYKWTVTNGVFTANNSTTIEGFEMQDVHVTWNNVYTNLNFGAPTGLLQVQRLTCPEIVQGDPEFNYFPHVIIKTLNNVTPSNINGLTTVSTGITGDIIYSIAPVQFPNTGPNNLDPTPRFA